MTELFSLIELQKSLYTSKNPTRRWLHCTRRDWVIGILEKHVHKRNQRALEVGFGSGVYLPTLAKLFDEVIVSDVENTFIKHASKFTEAFPNISLIIDNIADSKLPETSFDLILCSEVVEHIENSASAFTKMHRLLKSGGILILTTPQRYSLLELIAKIVFMPGVINLVRIIYREPILEMGHINLMTRKQVVMQLKEAGFRIREHYKTGMYIPFVAEFMGQSGQRLEQWFENILRDGPFNGLLWTQYYIAEA